MYLSSNWEWLIICDTILLTIQRATSRFTFQILELWNFREIEKNFPYLFSQKLSLEHNTRWHL